MHVEATIDLSSQSNFYTGFSNDVSTWGVFVAAASVPPVGTSIELAVRLSGERRFDATGVVRWTRETDALESEAAPGFGVELVALPQGVREEIERFVQNRDPLFFPD
jgi:uncharacterized protein (TIGR02266 family)